MKIHDPTPDELRKMDDFLHDIKDKTFQMLICIRDKNKVDHKKSLLRTQLKEKKLIIEQLQQLVRGWSYVPLCAACYLKYVTNCIFPVYAHNFFLSP
uniref:AsIV-cont00035-ORF1 n=1 Tax=Apophua simplicipes ichnovirus TaxID=1329648 RepID=S5DR47_9VIRU|nr:AsIV-cont00035-ORF1 [Apophua simplicipes ichnovirus]